MQVSILSFALAAAVALAGAGLGGSASAKAAPQQVTATFTGVAGGTDTFGVFGPAGGNISFPSNFTLSFTINERNTNQATGNTAYVGPGTADLRINGQDFSIVNTPTSSSNTVLSEETFTIKPGNLTLNEFEYAAQSTYEVPVTRSVSFLYALSAEMTLPILDPSPTDYHSYPLNGFAWTSTPNDPGFSFLGSLLINTSDPTADPTQEMIDLFPLSLTVTSVRAPPLAKTPPGVSVNGLRVGSGQAVPEPGTWALLLGGVALTGAALRRRQPLCTKAPC